MHAFLFLVLGLLGFPVTTEADAFCRFELPSRAYGPGDVALAVMSCDAAPVSSSARFGDAELPFFPLSEAPAAAAGGRSAVAGTGSDGEASPLKSRTRLGLLFGIDVIAEPGSPVLEWQTDFGGGDYESGMQVLRVGARRFPLQNLKVPPRFAQPDSTTLHRIHDEARRLGRVFTRRTEQRLWRGAFAAPLPTGRGGGFGARRVLNGVPAAPHTGIDLPAPAGQPVHAPNGAVVALVDTLYLGGKTIVLDHGLGLYTLYSHLSQVSVVPGDSVRPGQLIGRVGSSGRATGPHLHWAVHLNGARVDPIALIAATHGLPLEGAKLRPPVPPRD